MKNYKLLIINGSGALRAGLIFSPKALKLVRRTPIPFIIYRLSFIIYNFFTPCLTGLFILLVMNAWADTPGIPTQGQHPKRIYIAADNKRYMARELPLYLYISSTPGGENAVPLEQKNIPPSSIRLLLPEGLNVLKRTGPAAVKDSPQAPDSDSEPGYEIYIDGTPPVTTAGFPGAPMYEKEGNRYYGKGLTMDLVSRDLLSGVRETYLSVNNKPYAPQQGSYNDFPADTLSHLRYYAVDQVGNVEKPVETTFYLDVTPPRGGLTVKGDHAEGTLSPGSILGLTAGDTLSGVKEIYYKWDEGAESIYTGEITPAGLPEGNHTLGYYAVDQTGNVEEMQIYRFFYDQTAPEANVSVEGDKGEREGMVFVSNKARIRIEAPDNHAGTAAIGYTIDAGEEQTYEEPFLLPQPGGTHRVTYRAVDKVGNWSEPRTWSVYLDTTPPDTQYQISGYYAGSQRDIVLRKDVPVFLVSTDLEAGVKEIRYNIDGGETSVYKDFLKFETNGRHTLTYWGVDGANNGEGEKKLELRVDNSLKGTDGNDSGRYPRQWYADKTGKLTGTVDIPFYLLLATSDKDNGQWFLLDLPKLGADTGQSVMFKKGGTAYLQLQAGGPGGRADMFQVQIDALPPVTRAVLSGAKTYEAGGEVYFGPGLTVAVDARDDGKGTVSGYRETYVSLDDSPFFTYKTPLNIFSREKAYRFRYYSVDNVGNAEEVKEMKFTVDTTPPVTTWKVSGMTQGRILSPQSLIELSAVDNLTGVKELFYRFDAQPEKKYGRPLEKSELGPLAMGEHVLYFYAQDQTGNREKTGELSFYFDTAQHTLELKVTGDRHDKGEVMYVSPRSRLGFAAAGAEQTPIKNILYQVDGGQEILYDNTFFQPPGASGASGGNSASGRHILSYTGSDAVGNTSKKQTRVLLVDTEPPRTRIKIGDPVYRDRYSTFAGSRTLMELAAEDDHSGVKAIYYRVDGSPAKEYRGPFSVQAGGKHTLTYYAVDMVNNSEKPIQMAFQIDNEPPELQVTYNAEPRKDSVDGIPVYPRDLAIGFNAVDWQTEVDKIIYRFNNGKELLYRNLVSDFEPGKVYTLTVYALDRLGNKREQSVVFRVE